jgi:competence protein ComEA
VSNHQQQRASWDIGSRGVQVLAVFAVLVAVVAAVLAWSARPEVTPLAPHASSAVPVVIGSGDVVVVAVSGKVRRPGLVRLPAGARVADAIDAAGGVLPGTDISSINLARKVNDGELIVVGAPASAAPSPGRCWPGQPEHGHRRAVAVAAGGGAGARPAHHRLPHSARRLQVRRRPPNVTGIGDARYNDLKNRVTV